MKRFLSFCLFAHLLFFQGLAQELQVKFLVLGEDSKPLKGAWVRLLKGEEYIREVKTRDDGFALFQIKLNGEFQLVFSRKGYEGRVINASTVVPESQAGLMHEFPQIKVNLIPMIGNLNVEMKFVSEIFFNNQTGVFAYKSSSTKRIKDFKIKVIYFSDMPMSEALEEMAKEEMEHKIKKEREENEGRKAKQVEHKEESKKTEEEAEKNRLLNENRSKATSVKAEIAKSVTVPSGPNAEEAISRNAEQVENTALHEKTEKAKAIQVQKAREKEIQRNKEAKYGKTSPMMDLNEAFGRDASPKP